MKRFSWVKYVIAFLLPMLVAMAFNQQALDNDSWYVLAEGREIVENGIYHEDTLSMHEGLHVVVQNYGFAAIFYLIYSVFGAPGIYIAMLILDFLVLLLLYKICMLISNKNTKLALILTAVTGVMLGFGFVVTRAQMVDYVVFLALIYVMELFIKTGKTKYLWWIPALSLIMANLHASSWWIIFAIMAAYIVDGMRRPKKFLQGYRLKPLILMFVVSAVVGVINPYGIEMIVSVFASYSGLAKLGYVDELQSFNPTGSIYNLLYYIALMVALVLYIYAKRKVRIRYLILIFGFLLMGMSSVRGLSELILVMFFPLAFVYKDWKAPKILYSEKVGQAIAIWTGIVITSFTLCYLVVTVVGIETRPNQAMEEAMNVIDKEVGERDKKELKVYVGYDQGGYVEYRGYPAYLDPRGEYFLKSINKKEDILKERINLNSGRLKVEDFLNKYDFDFLVIEEYYEDSLKDLEDERYELIYSSDENETRVYKKVEADSKV